MKFRQLTFFLFLMSLLIESGCEKPTNGISFDSIPWYPAASPEQRMEGSGKADIGGGKIIQLSTADPFDSVVEFYSDELDRYNPEIVLHKTGGGRKTAITIKQEGKAISVTVQEHGAGDRILITHMVVGG